MPKRLLTLEQTGRRRKNEGPSQVTWEIEQVGDSCLLKVMHDQLRESVNTQLYGGWPMVPVLSGIKTLLETGGGAHNARIASRVQGMKEHLPEVTGALLTSP